MEEIDWLYQLKNKVPYFLDLLQEEAKPGFFRYSLSNDLQNHSTNWGLGNTVFAVKIYYTLGLLERLPTKRRDSMSKFIKSFQDDKGFFFDPLIHKKSSLINIISAIKNVNLNNISGQQTKTAETRQSISALNLLNQKPNTLFVNFPQTKKNIAKYLRKLEWHNPWGAGSHFSHLLFFLANSELDNKDDLINFSINWINSLQHKIDGCWYEGHTSIQQKINGAMKIITGLKAVNKTDFNYPKKLIDTCLSVTNDSHACDNFNIIYVLKYANELTKSTYRYMEIRQFCYNRIKLYRQYYFPNIGGFSFYKNKANDVYYGAKITKGLNEPDIHGTVMFLWGISIITQILKINDKLKFKEFIT